MFNKGRKLLNIMNLVEFKEFSQKHFSDGLVTIAGSGLSAAEGLPTMQLLGENLSSRSVHLSEALKISWEAVAKEINAGKGLEESLKNNSNEGLLAWIIQETAEYLLKEEARIFSEVITGKKKLRFTELLTHLIFNNERQVVITPNYDRLLELASEVGGYGVDSFFVGNHHGHFDPKMSNHSMCSQISEKFRGGIKLGYRKHIVVIKPHGSLDWFYSNEAPVRCSIAIDCPRLMIAPGVEKYRKGYEIPFDQHINEANKAIDRAARYLILGYGFNDEHLETHLRQELKKGKPCLVLCKELTKNGMDLIKECPQIMAVTDATVGKEASSKVYYQNKEYVYSEVNLWDLKGFLREVFNHV